MSAYPVLCELRDGVAHVRLNRPHAANALDLPTARALASAVQRAGDEQARAVLLTGAGPRFCAGGDVTSFLAGDDPAADVADLAATAGAAVSALCELPVPVVAAVSGAAAGAGLALVCAADLVVAHPATRFATAYAEIGLTPDCGVSWLLPQVVGLRRALELTLSRRAVTGEEALSAGLVTELSEQPEERAAELAAQLAAGPAGALGMARRLLRSTAEPAERARLEVETIAGAVSSPEAVELIAAFVSRRR